MGSLYLLDKHFDTGRERVNAMGNSWPTNAEQHAHMRMRQNQNKATSARSKAEQWMADKLKFTGFKWTRQAQSGFRLFDFWCHVLGVAVEVDGPEHDVQRDHERDVFVAKQRAIVVIRVRNFNEEDAALCLQAIALTECWNSRRVAAGLAPVDMAG